MFDDLCKIEKELLKQHKSTFKSLIKNNNIRFDKDVKFTEFDEFLTKYPQYTELDDQAKMLLHEYYLYKVAQKEQEKLRKHNKLIKQCEHFIISKLIKKLYDPLKDNSDHLKEELNKNNDFSQLTSDQKS